MIFRFNGTRLSIDRADCFRSVCFRTVLRWSYFRCSSALANEHSHIRSHTWQKWAEALLKLRHTKTHSVGFLFLVCLRLYCPLVSVFAFVLFTWKKCNIWQRIYISFVCVMQCLQNKWVFFKELWRKPRYRTAVFHHLHYKAQICWHSAIVST